MIIIAISLVLSMSGCAQSGSQQKKYRETKMLMGTIVQMDVCENRTNRDLIPAAYEEAWARLEDISWRMNVYDDKSDVTQINNSLNEEVTVGADTFKVIERAFYYTVITEGAFDVTIWPLIELWKIGAQANERPTHEQILNIKNNIGIQHFQLLGKNRIVRNNQVPKIDLGGIAKGYAVDEAARIFREHGLPDFFIDAGGDIYAGGSNCSGAPWSVGIRDPRNHEKILDTVAVTDTAVTTSGNYEQYFDIQGQRWSHIINPNTGFPQKDVVSATVIAPTAMDADALSTAMTIMGGVAGGAHIDSLGEKYACLILVKNELGEMKRFPSKAFRHYLMAENGIKNKDKQ